ncbi:MAG: protein phosphatase 2C domain-containing protein [Lachnospiraceae bacterium]|nr:protein phosphatase 2C domain-containing protein [Lachnospiraceae bacterium]
MELHYTVAAQTDAGIVKQVNQDSLTVKVANTPYGETAIAVICDGMGGLEQGEIASAVVVRTYEQWFLKELPSALNESGGRLDESWLRESWDKLANDCNTRILDYSRERRTTMGTTLTVLLLFEGSLYISHVGDCRVYQMTDSDNKMNLLTTDQTYVAREVALGHMTPQQAENDARKNVLLQCIGTVSHVAPDFLSGAFQIGDSFLLCSDGFRHELSEREMYDYCHLALEQIEWHVNYRQENSRLMSGQLKYLIEQNKSRMEKDNISAILLKVMDR